MATGKFKRGTNAGTAKCSECGVTFQRANIDMGTLLCETGNPFCCYDIEGEHNAHSDGHHARQGECPDNCPMAHPELQDVLSGAAFRYAQGLVDEDQKRPYQVWNTTWLETKLVERFGLSEHAALYVAGQVWERNKRRPYVGRDYYHEG